MMGNYQGYQKYKDSGVEWLGDIPEHWEAVGLTKYLQSLVDYRGKTPEKTKDGIFLVTAKNIKNGIIDYSLSQEFIKEDEYDEIMRRGKPEIGDVLLTTEAPLGEVANVDNTNIALAQRVIKMRGKIGVLYNYFLKYWILGASFSQNIQSLCTGSTALGIKASKLCLLKVVLPPLNEQEKIAQFLDYKTKQIDELIKKKETLIEKLDEKRTAIISHAVTKGLDSSVPIKDSGIEWLGDIPKHWKIIPIKRFSQIYDCKHKTVSFVDDGIPVASIAQVQNFYIDLLIAKMTTKEEFIEMIEGGRKPQNGDIILSRNATVGASAIVQDDLFCMGQDVCLIRPVKANSVFLNYNFLAFFTKSQIDTCLLGSTFKRINVEEVKNLLICLPLLEEQKQIAQYLDQKTAQIDQQKAKIKQAIELLKEYRTSLITNAVTGKIDVSQIAIPSPQKPQPQKG
ncbi:MAG: hypothetical protein AN488_02770 [Anabaena sp. WA113]|nr:MAG: hypothetical protein AN488_02770 [Anabaena sp. WA113]